MSAQGVFLFPGITGEISASVTWTKGISPSVTRVTVSPDVYPSLQRVGTAQWYYDGQLIRSCPFSVISSVEKVDRGGQSLLQLLILDRRWGWRFGQITGEYNVRVKGKTIPSREKTPRELASLCLDAMGEGSYDVQQLPNDDRPYINWAIDNPAKSLQSLCDLYSCEVSYEIDNSIKIVRKGQGATIPVSFGENMPILSREQVFDPAELPERQRVVSAATRWQVDLLLEPYGREVGDDGEFVPIDDLSYAPTGQFYDDNGVSKEEPSSWLYASDSSFRFLQNTEKEELAKKHIHKTYKVSIEEIKTVPVPDSPLPVDYELPEDNYLNGAIIPLTDVKQILPYIAEQVEASGVGESARPKEAVVWGVFDRGKSIGRIAREDLDEVTIASYDVSRIYEGSVTFDEERGLVHFPERQRLSDENGNPVPPKMWLRCSINLYDPNTREVQRYARDVVIDSTSPAGIAYEVREDIQPEYYESRSGETVAWRNNINEITDELNFYLTQSRQQYQALPALSATFAGFVPLNLDGAIQQVTYSITESGEALSSVGRNVELSREAISFKKQKELSELKAALAERDKSKRKQRKPIPKRRSKDGE